MKKQPVASEEKPTSFFEFWPTKLMYTPVMFQWLYLAIKHRSLTLPLIANPKLTLSGMVGVRKSELLNQATGTCKHAILTWKNFLVSEDESLIQATNWINKTKKIGIELPFVCKPDIGCRGSGVKLIKSLDQLSNVIESYPEKTSLMIQKLASYQDEAGVFYVKLPNQTKGEVVSLTFKHSPMVIGDGKRTLKELMQQDYRAKDLLHMYQQRHAEIWDEILEKDKQLYLIFSASHCQGAVFEDARNYITQALTDSINDIMDGLPEFYYGRLDIKFKNIQELKKGKTIEIIEINGASAESIHIWDKKTKLKDAIKTLLWQYKTLFILGNYNNQKGYKPPGIKKLYKYWRLEKQLAKYYPDTD